MTLHRRRASPVAFEEPSTPREHQRKPAPESEIQRQMRFQNVYTSMVTSGGVQTAVVCAGSLSVRSCKLLWKPALFQLVATTTAPSHANTIDVADDEDSEEEESKEDNDVDKKDKDKEDRGKRGSLRYSLVYFQRGLLGRARRKRIDLSDGSAHFNWSKDGRLLSTRFEFSIDYFAASSTSDRAVAKTLTCRASNATDYLEWTSALRTVTEYAAEQWRLQSLSRLTLGSSEPTRTSNAQAPTSPAHRQRVSVVAAEPAPLATKQHQKQRLPSASPSKTLATPAPKLERQVTRSRRSSVSSRRVPKSSFKKPTTVKQLPPFRERRCDSSAKPMSANTASNCNASAAASASIAQSKKLAMAPPPMQPSNNSSRCFLTTSNSFSDTKATAAQVFNSSRSLASSFVSSTRSRRRMRTPKSGLTVFSSRRRNFQGRRRRGSVVKPASMAKMVRLRAVDSPFSASAIETSTRNKSARPIKRPQSELRLPTNPLAQPLAQFHPYHPAAQPRQRANVTRRRVRAESNALDALLLVSQRSSSSDDSCSEARPQLTSTSASAFSARRACPPSPAPSIREYLASAHRPLIQSSSGHIANIPSMASVVSAASAPDIETSNESLPMTQTTEFIDYLVLVAELRAQSQGAQPVSQRETRPRTRSSAPAVLTREDSLFLTARSALDLEAGDFTDSDDDDADESSETDDDSRRQAWRAYLSSFETEL